MARTWIQYRWKEVVMGKSIKNTPTRTMRRGGTALVDKVPYMEQPYVANFENAQTGNYFRKVRTDGWNESNEIKANMKKLQAVMLSKDEWPKLWAIIKSVLTLGRRVSNWVARRVFRQLEVNTRTGGVCFRVFKIGSGSIAFDWDKSFSWTYENGALKGDIINYDEFTAEILPLRLVAFLSPVEPENIRDLVAGATCDDTFADVVHMGGFSVFCIHEPYIDRQRAMRACIFGYDPKTRKSTLPKILNLNDDGTIS